MYMMTRNSNHVIAPTAQAASPAIIFLFLYKVALLSLSLFFLYRVVVGVVVFVGVLVVIAMLKSLHLAEICTLASTF